MHQVFLVKWENVHIEGLWYALVPLVWLELKLIQSRNKKYGFCGSGHAELGPMMFLLASRGQHTTENVCRVKVVFSNSS